MRSTRIASALTVLGAVAILTSCGEQSLVGPRPAVRNHASLAIAPRFDLAPGSPVVLLGTVKGLLISAAGDTIATEATFTGDVATLTFDVSFSGSSADYTLVVIGYDLNGIEAYTATEPITVKAGETPQVTQPTFVASGPDTALKSITVSPRSITLNAGGSTPFHINGTNAAGQPTAPVHFGWHSTDPSIVAVDDSGVATAGPSEGSAYVVALTTTGLSDSALVKVHAPVASVVVTPSSAQVIRGQSTQASAALADGGGHPITDRTVAWSSSDASIATVDTTGLIQGVGVGTATITASAEGKSGSLALTVLSSVDHIDLTPTTAALTTLHQTQQLHATLVPRSGGSVAGLTVAYTSDNAAAASVDANGLVTANGNGTANITASADGATAIAVVTVKLAAVGVAITPDTATLTSLGATAQLQAHAVDALGGTVSGFTISLSSDKPTVASVDANGVVMAHANGTATITATSGSFSATAAITVRQTAATVTVTPHTAGVNSLGDTRSFSATSVDALGNAMPAPTFAWSSSDPTIATVDQTGVATAKKGGTVTITASADGKAGTATFQVLPVPVGIQVSVDTAQLKVGDGTNAHAQYEDRNGNPLGAATVTWSVSPSGVVTIDQTGHVAAVGGGTATITARGGGMTGTTDIVVLAPPGGHSASGRVIDASTNAPIPNATISSGRSSATAGADGSFTLSGVDSGATLAIAATGYVSTQYFGVVLSSASTQIGTIPLAPASTLDGSVSGTVSDAVTESRLSGATITARSGINAVSGPVVAQVTSGEGGSFSGSLPAGTYTITIAHLGYASSTLTVASVGGVSTPGAVVTLSPTGTGSEYRIVLTWAAVPPDLDGHLFGPDGAGGQFHVFYGDRTAYDQTGGILAQQDVDHTDGFGPETITIPQTVTGTYQYVVHQFCCSDGNFSTGNATVRVFRGSQQVATFFPPALTGEGEDDVWSVFDLDGATGVITPVGTVARGAGEPGSFGGEAARPLARAAAPDMVSVVRSSARGHPKRPNP